jgi:NADH-quinone oxidoreductase subunit J
MFELLFFSVYGLILIGAAIGVVTSRNPVNSAMFLVLCFVTSAALWLMLEAEFLAMVLVLVYVGAVMVLFLFVVMMLDIKVAEKSGSFTKYAPLGLVVAAIAVAEMAWVIWFKSSGLPVMNQVEPHPADYSNTKELGAVLYTEHVYAFELASFILLLAIVAAIVLTMRKRAGLKLQNVSEQVAVRREDRVRMVKMEAERD